MSQLTTILNPLESYTTAYYISGNTIWPDIHNQRKDHMSHAEFVRRQVLPLLTDAHRAWGDEVVAQELLEVAVPMYARLPANDMITFWHATIRGLEDGIPKEQRAFASRNAGKMNPDLAAKIGVKRLFAPILDLAAVHHETKVFSVHKFLYTHATRMGNIVTMFPYEDYIAYIELSKKLLRGNIFDWSIENDEEQWAALAPIIRRFGLRAVIEPVVDAMITLSSIPGTKDEKYKSSHFAHTFRDLVPLLVLVTLAEESTDVIGKTLNPIVKTVQDLHARGAFRGSPWSHYREEREFFSCFSKQLPLIVEVGMEHMLQELTTRWAPRLIPNGRRTTILTVEGH